MNENSENPQDGGPEAEAGAQMPSWMPGRLDEDGEDSALAAHEDEDSEDLAEDEAAQSLEAPVPDAPHAAPVTVTLGRKTRAHEAEDLVEQLRAVPGNAPLVIDAQEVEDISAAAIASLISALHSRADMTPPAAVLAPTPAFVDAFSDLGLFQDLMKMEFRQ